MLFKTEEQLDKSVYEGLKESFKGIGGWIYQDYFQDPVSGYEHFIIQFQQDYPTPRSEFEDEQDFEDCVYDYVEEISSVLRRNNFMSLCQQSI